MTDEERKLTPADVLNLLAINMSEQADDTEEASDRAANPLMKDALGKLATILSGVALAVSESADEESSEPLSSLADLVAAWSRHRTHADDLDDTVLTINPLHN